MAQQWRLLAHALAQGRQAMSQTIHMMYENGKPRYRVWSNTVDAYVSEVFDDVDALKAYVLEVQLERVRHAFERDFEGVMRRVYLRGTSSPTATRSTTRWDAPEEETDDEQATE